MNKRIHIKAMLYFFFFFDCFNRIGAVKRKNIFFLWRKRPSKFYSMKEKKTLKRLRTNDHINVHNVSNPPKPFDFEVIRKGVI